MEIIKSSTLIDLLSDQISETPLSAFPEIPVNKVRYSPKRFDRSTDERRILPSVCPPTQKGIAYGYVFNRSTSPTKVINYLGGTVVVKELLFGLQQIRCLAAKQKPEKKEGVLDLNAKNYFPILDISGNIRFAYIHYARYKSPDKLVGAHSWELFIQEKNKGLPRGSRLFIFQKEELPLKH